ncbi:MAG: type II toxin-antitoxin system VapC family toxin [Terriglobales bacterium]
MDASIVLRWILAGEVPPLARRARELVVGGIRAMAPDLWQWEVANSIVMAERRDILGASFADSWRSAEYWFALVATDERPPSAVNAAQVLARRHHLTVYDAAYLELSLRLQAPLATLDQALQRAARRAGVMTEF